MGDVSLLGSTRTVVESTKRLNLVVVLGVLSTGQSWWWLSAELRWPRHCERRDVAKPWCKHRQIPWRCRSPDANICTADERWRCGIGKAAVARAKSNYARSSLCSSCNTRIVVCEAMIEQVLLISCVEVCGLRRKATYEHIVCGLGRSGFRGAGRSGNLDVVR